MNLWLILGAVLVFVVGFYVGMVYGMKYAIQKFLDYLYEKKGFTLAEIKRLEQEVLKV